MKNLSLKSQLIALVAGLSIILMSLFGITAYEMSVAIRQGKETAVRTAAEDLMDKIDRNLFERYGDVQAFSVSEPARSGDPKRIVPFMNDMMPTYAPIYSLMMVVNTKGKVIAVNTADKDGKPLDTSSLLGKDYSDSEWFKKAMNGDIKAGTAYVKELYADPEVAAIYKNNGYAMNFTSPIRSADGNHILGVWTNRMSWADVVQQITMEQISAVKSASMKQIFPTILNKDGLVLLHPEGEKTVLKEKDADFSEQVAGLEGAAHGKVTSLKAAYPGYEGPLYEGTMKSKGYSTYPGLGWYGAVAVPTEDPLYSLLWTIITISAAVSLFILFYSYWVVRGISNKFSGVIRVLSNESRTLNTSSSDLARNSTSLAEAATEQAASIQETASSVEEISSMVNKSADSAQRSMKMANISNETATRGKRTIDEMITSIQEISQSNSNIMTQIEQSNQRLTDIIKVISEIGNKTKVINDIVFQTKLLSFNASVEAARAGEHGKGFAVVAEEVGNLAQMSGNASKEISDMLNESIRTVQSIVEETKGKVERLIQDGKSKVDTGIRVAKQCGDVLEEIVKNETEVSTMISEISTASHEQATGVSEINKAIAQLDSVTQKNASIAQGAAKYAADITARANTLESQVVILSAIVLGGSKNSTVANNIPAEKPVYNSTQTVSAPVNNTSSVPDNVVPITRALQPKSQSTHDLGLKTAMGDAELPKSNDPRFVEL